MASSVHVRSSRSKRKRTINIQLSKQDLQEYLDDGYTAVQIGKDFGVGANVITEKIKKYGVSRRKKPKKVVRRKPTTPTNSRGKGSPARASPRKIPTGRSPRGRIESDSETEPITAVVDQFIKDNPKDNLHQIHSLLKSMGFDFPEGIVLDHMLRVNRGSKSEATSADNSSQEVDNTQTVTDRKRGRGRQRMNSVEGKVGEGNSSTEGLGDITETTEDDGKGDNNVEATPEETNKQSGETVVCGNETLKDIVACGQTDEDNGEIKLIPGKDGDASESRDDSAETESVVKRNRGRPRKGGSRKKEAVVTERRGRPRKKPVRYIDEDEASQEGDINKKAEDTVDKDWEEGSKPKNMEQKQKMQEPERKVRPKRRGRPRYERDSEGMCKRGRPSLVLTEENLRHCIDSGLPRQEIAEVFGTCSRSLTRYLSIHKMRKKDKFSKIPDAELDGMVANISEEHPNWGQIHIQKNLEKRGLYFRRAQIRNSVRRVDPVGIELRKLNNLKQRWNRGSAKTLNKVLPADGINMTSTASFLWEPPRTGLNGLNINDCKRLLEDIVSSGEKKYVQKEKKHSTSLSKEVGATSSGEKSEGVDQGASSLHSDELVTAEGEGSSKALNETEKEENIGSDTSLQTGDLFMAIENIETTGEELTQVSNETENEENIGPDIDKMQIKSVTDSMASSGNASELYLRQRLYKMVMCSKRSGPDPASGQRGPEVVIPRDTLEDCMKRGFSSARIADRFETNKDNVRKYLDLYKLGKAKRYEQMSEQTMDEAVRGVMRESPFFLTGREVCEKVREKGLRIRKQDIRRSMCRLHPSGLHRSSISALKRTREIMAKESAQNVTYVRPSELPDPSGMDGTENEEDVIILDTDELAKLMNAEGGIVLVDEYGREILNNEGGMSSFHSSQTRDEESDIQRVLEHSVIKSEGEQEVFDSHQEQRTNGVADFEGEHGDLVSEAIMSSKIRPPGGMVMCKTELNSNEDGAMDVSDHGNGGGGACIEQVMTKQQYHINTEGIATGGQHYVSCNEMGMVASSSDVDTVSSRSEVATMGKQYISTGGVGTVSSRSEVATTGKQYDSTGDTGTSSSESVVATLGKQYDSAGTMVSPTGVPLTDHCNNSTAVGVSRSDVGVTMVPQLYDGVVCGDSVSTNNSHHPRSVGNPVLSHGDGDMVSQIQNHCGDGQRVVVVSDQSQVVHVPSSVEGHTSHHVQSSITNDDNEISAIILEFNFPEGQDASCQVRQEPCFSNEQQSQQVYVIEGIKKDEEVSSVVLVDDESGGGSTGEEPQHIIMQLTDDVPSSHSNPQLTSLNTVRPSELSAQVLLELNRIAQLPAVSRSDQDSDGGV